MKVIITGTTGMVGEGVLLACLAHPAITEILSVSRKSTYIKHPKLKELIVPDFLSLDENNEQLHNYDACFYCAGISSVGVNDDDYKRISYDTTLHFAKVLKPNPNMSFMYVSGAGTDNTEKSSMTWARVKGRAENDLMKLPFRQAFGFRPAFIKPFKGQKHMLKPYKYLGWLFYVLNVVYPNGANTMTQLAQSMIYATLNGYEKNIIEPKDIRIMSEKLA